MEKQLKWKELGINEKVKLIIAATLVLASVILGFVSFIILYEIPGSVIGIDGLWLSTALAILGITSYFNNEMIKFQTRVQDRLDRLDRLDHIDKNRLVHEDEILNVR